MRALRGRREEAGIPDRATLDRCIVDALRSEIARLKRDDSTDGHVYLGEILKVAQQNWKSRLRKAREAGRPVPEYDPAPVVEALKERLWPSNVTA